MREKFPRLIVMAKVVKRDKKLLIVEVSNDEILYALPDFIKLHSREPLIELATSFTYYDEIPDRILEWETKMRPSKLDEPKMKFEDTFSAETVVMEKYFNG